MPKGKHPHNPGLGQPPAQPPGHKKVIDVARDLALAGMNARMFDSASFDKPEALAKYCIDVAVNIVEYDGDIDVDDDRT